MIDVLGEGLRATASRSPFAYPLVFAAGVLTSAGPCVAPRYVAVAALANASRRPWRIIGAFVAGIVGAYVALGLAATSLGALWTTSRTAYAALAVALIAGGVVTLFREPHAGRTDRCSTANARVSVGGPFLLGGSSALVVSPCCTPVLAAIAGLTASSGRVADGVLLSAAFACGHAVPLAAVGSLGTKLSALLSRAAGSHAAATVSGSLMLATGAYYGALA